MKVAILGCAPSSRMAPFHDESWEIWGTGINGSGHPRWTRWFQIHDIEQLAQAKPPEVMADIAGWLSGFKGPVYMQQEAPGVPGCTIYPFEEMIEKFGRNMTSTACWMLALAIAEGAEEIAIYGVDMGSEGEYAEQRPGVRFFEGWARGAGIKVTVTASSSLSRCNFLYGLEDKKYGAFAAHKERIEKAKWQAEATKIRAEREEYELKGALSMMKMMIEDRI